MAIVEVVSKKTLGFKVRLGQQSCFFFITEKGWKKALFFHLLISWVVCEGVKEGEDDDDAKSSRLVGGWIHCEEAKW